MGEGSNGSNHFVQEFVAGWFGGIKSLLCVYSTSFATVFNFLISPAPAGVAGLLAGHPFDTIKVL